MRDYSQRRRQGLGTLLDKVFRQVQKGPQLSNVMLYSRLTTFLLFGVIGGVIFVFLLFLWFSRDLPTPGKLTNTNLAQSTRIFDRKGELLYSVYQDQNRVYVPLTTIPKYLQQATIAIEDKNFYSNKGFSITGYLRAVRNLILFRGIAGGGSTLTQQLVKNVLLTSEQSLPRKIKELILSVQVDQRYSKDQILEMYLNDVPYGGTNIGVEAASEAYFGKKVKDLNLAQSAMLAGIPQAPTLYSPYRPERYYLNRTRIVLEQMAASGYISQKQRETAMKEIENTKFSPENTIGLKAPHFVMFIKQYLVNQLHFTEQQVANGGLQVTTTLDYGIEKNAEKIMREEVTKLKKAKVGNGAAIVGDPKTGEILAMVGNKDYFDNASDGMYNDALAMRQPGSSLKPILYATAFNKGYTPASVLMDVKTEFPTNEPAHPTYIPENYDLKFRGPIQVRFALANSLNIPAVKLLADVGVKDVMQTAFDMGITNWEPTPATLKTVGLALILGGRETTLLQEITAYSVFANKGVRHDPVFVLKVTDSQGHTLYQNHQTQGKQILSPEVSFLISHILSDNIARSMEFTLYSLLNIPGKTVSVKTGTTDQKRDNWTIGYTPSYTVGVWVGNNDNTPMDPIIASGITGATPIWNKIMTSVLKGKTDELLEKPDKVTALVVDSLGGGLPVNGGQTRSEYFIKGTEPTGSSVNYQNVKISRFEKDKLANAAEISHGDYDVKQYILFKEKDPVSTDGKNRWQEGIDAWLKTAHSAADAQYYPPTQTSGHTYSDSDNQPTATPTPTTNQSNTPTPTLSPTSAPTSTPIPTFTPTPTPTPTP